MKKTFKIALMLILALSSLKANAAVLTNNQVREIIAKQATEIYKNYTDAQVEVNVVGLPFKDLTLPDGKVSFKIISASEKFSARDLEKVSVYVNNNLVRTFNAPVVVKAYRDVLVASSQIDREQTINLSNVRIERKEVSNIIGRQLTPADLDKGFLAKKFFSEGEIIDKRFVKAKPEILRSANVTVFFSSNDLTVTIEGTALSDGGMGETICVLNKDYNKIYKGTVIGANRVLVKI